MENVLKLKSTIKTVFLGIILLTSVETRPNRLNDIYSCGTLFVASYVCGFLTLPSLGVATMGPLMACRNARDFEITTIQIGFLSGGATFLVWLNYMCDSD